MSVKKYDSDIYNPKVYLVQLGILEVRLIFGILWHNYKQVCDPFGTPFLSHGYISLFFNKRYIFKWLFFHCHASSAGGIYILHVIPLIFICDLLYDEDWIIEGFSSQNGPLHGQQAIPVKVPWSMMHIQSYACIFVCLYGWRSEFPVSRVAWTKNS